MNCELCGKDSGYLKKMVIEQSILNVCAQCAKFGKPVPESATRAAPIGPAEAPSPTRRKWVPKDVFDETSTRELVIDYPQRIKKARLSRGWTPEEFGRVINEKKSIITKLESGELRPDRKLTSKLERTLNIKLMEDVKEIKVKASKKTRSRTLGDVVNIK